MNIRSMCRVYIAKRFFCISGLVSHSKAITSLFKKCGSVITKSFKTNTAIMEDELKLLAQKLAERKGLNTSELILLMDNGLAEPIITHGRQPERPRSDEGKYLGGFTLTEKGRNLAAE